ncbi:enoyl-CoA hydratase/isomerase family protein [Aspergillus undulatus]|uniref:enoyl-CoA hydratase/isomerase family protein n=1 Tax=Aspergillus undulatus TaxID=1810928 RepID=UPI003CCD53B0
MATTLFTVPIPPPNPAKEGNPRGSITVTNPPSSDSKLDTKKIYILTFTSPPDNRLTPSFITTFLLALDILEHRYPRGVLITTSGIGKFYSNGLDLQLANETEGFLEKYLWRIFRRLITYPMPTISLLNGHAFAGGFMLAMYHDYRIMNPTRGFLCINEIEFGVPLQGPMMKVFTEKLSASTARDLVLEAKRVGGVEALQRGVVDGVGGVDEVLAFVKERGLTGKVKSGIYGVMKEEMYRGILGVLDDHEGNLKWRGGVEEGKVREEREGARRVEEWERQSGRGGKSNL